MAKTLVTGGTGFLGSHLVRALAERGDELRLLARRRSELDHLDEVEFERSSGDVTDRRAVRRAMEGVDRVFHVAGPTSMRAADRDGRLRPQTCGGTRIVLEEALAAGVKRVVHTRRSRRDRAREAEGHRRRATAVHRRPSRHRLRQLQARGRAGGVQVRRPRARRRDRQPHLRPRPRRPERDLDGAGAPLLPRPDPGLRRRRRSTSSTSATSPRATCSPTRRARSASATSWAGATSPSTACSPTWPGSRGRARRR